MLHALATFGAYLVDDAAGTYLGANGKTNINYEQVDMARAMLMLSPCLGVGVNSAYEL